MTFSGVDGFLAMTSDETEADLTPVTLPVTSPITPSTCISCKEFFLGPKSIARY